MRDGPYRVFGRMVFWTVAPRGRVVKVCATPVRAARLAALLNQLRQMPHERRPV